ncbi:rhamnogalacturonate lyase B isoform X2 [Hevea brasiliensis]|uniref:rhamnogalacturonate lyase B isoform X2 n=1 Tax=Hevea brasiliensis TaxID=3981 RepID=UPI0025D79916|nr:rhamnogalacturonate lyase B isoform X2 [Hevea brasiliensis]
MGKSHLLGESGWLATVLCFFFFLIACSAKTPVRKILRTTNNSSALGVQLQITSNQVVIDNGLVRVTFSSPGGDVIEIKYKGIDNILEIVNEEDNRGYWDVVWNRPGEPIIYDKLQATDFSVIMENEDQVEVSFSKRWSPSMDAVPLNVDKRYIIRRGSSGFYLYTILERLEGWPDVDMDQIRVVFKLHKEKFHFMALSDDRQRVMPMPEDRLTGLPLAYPEAVLLTNPINPELRGEVDDKYQYSCEVRDNRVHGWISDDPPVGFWMITPSNEFRVGGPTKQDLTSHVGPTVLNMFTSTHYAGEDLNTEYRNGEPWKKVLGPAYVYLNSISPSEDPEALWEDAKEQMSTEVRSWPYNFPQSEDFPSSHQRGNVLGQLIVRDRYINERLMHASFAYVGLAAPGDVGSWQMEAKGYQFWTQADRKGIFSINNVRAGNYSLYAWVPGIIGDYKYNVNIIIEPRSKIKLGVLVYDPPRNGPTLWEIGIPDRTASEFYVPDTYPTLMNKLYTNHPTDKFRQYGLWERYADMYPKNDLIYNVGVNTYVQDWFFAHVTREMGNKTYEATTWQIIFELESVSQSGNYTIQVALASAHMSELQVRVNTARGDPHLFTTGLIGKDNAIARHGIHGLYWLYSIQVPSSQLLQGNNIIYLTQSRSNSPFQGIMYDYIRLEAPRET